jgi:hypothetical protein
MSFIITIMQTQKGVVKHDNDTKYRTDREAEDSNLEKIACI